jgi:hypothetical protein
LPSQNIMKIKHFQTKCNYVKKITHHIKGLYSKGIKIKLKRHNAIKDV